MFNLHPFHAEDSLDKLLNTVNPVRHDRVNTVQEGDDLLKVTKPCFIGRILDDRDHTECMGTRLRDVIGHVVAVLVQYIEVRSGIAIIQNRIVFQRHGSECHHRLMSHLAGIHHFSVSGIECVDGKRRLAFHRLFLRQDHAESTTADGLPLRHFKVTGFLVFQHTVPSQRIQVTVLDAFLVVVAGSIDVLDGSRQKVADLEIHYLRSTVDYDFVVDVIVVDFFSCVDRLIALVVRVQIINIRTVLLMVINRFRKDISYVGRVDFQDIGVHDRATV